MKILQLVVILILSICIFGCAFEENQEVKKKLTESVNQFHNLFNQEKFEQIYSDGDDELKKELTEQNFISYLKSVKENNIDELEEVPQIWIKNESKDGIVEILFGKTKFFNTITVYTEKGIYLEHFEWNLTNGKPKLASYLVNKPEDNHKVSF